VTPREYRYLGPDGVGIGELPEGVGAALGSEYCVHLLPSSARMAEVVSDAAARRAPLLLLTPYFRDAELKRSIPLCRAIPEGADVDVAVNDWGALRTVRSLFPALRLSVGRLLSGQKRCPRIGASPSLTAEGRKWHGEGIFASPRARAFLEGEMGVAGYHVDELPWGGGGSPGREEKSDAALFLHSPCAIVTVSDSCPWVGGVSSARLDACDRTCRGDAVRLSNPSMGGDLFQKGKARFALLPQGDPPRHPRGGVVAVVRYPDFP
jgi:hypothetical protein